MVDEEQEPTKYKVIFQGCQHTCIMTAQELLNPSRQVDNSNASYNSDYYLCWDCVYDRPGKCENSPYHKVEVIIPITIPAKQHRH
jgi:hypothetical protein